MKANGEAHSYLHVSGFKPQVSFHLPLSSLQWLLSGLFLAALPLIVQLPEILFGFLSCLIWRFIIERRGWHIPPAWVRLLAGAAGALMILGAHGMFFSLVAAMGFLLLLIALKVLEMRTEREFMLLAFLAYFILLAALFFNQTLFTCVYVGAVFVLLTATLIHFTSGSAGWLGWQPLVRYALGLLLQALPIIVILFFFVPRPKTGSLLKIKRDFQAQSGISDEIDPGTFSELVLSNEVAFRADFPHGGIPPLGELYWRVAVFSECDGLAWRHSRQDGEPLRAPQLTGRKIVQRIIMPQQSGRRVYALDRPISAEGPASLTSGMTLTLNRDQPNFFGAIRVASKLGNDRTPISAEEWPVLRQPPELVSPRVQQLVDLWRQKTRDPNEIVRLALAYFRTEKFRYTLAPGVYEKDGLDEFLFERKQGFCEHFAASFASLMRVAGIPSRVVAGYHGGEFNPLGSYFTIRQSDAHAWAEVWLAEQGWVRYDVSQAVDPALVDPSTQLFARHGTSSDEQIADDAPSENSTWQAIRTAGRLVWDAANYEWNLWVLGFDQTMQRELYIHVGIRGFFSWRLVAIILSGVAVAVAIAAATLCQRSEKRDRVLSHYRRFCKDLASAGHPRYPNEGALDYSRRLATVFPQKSAAIKSLAEAFVQARYGCVEGRDIEVRLASAFKQLRRELLTGNR